MNLLEKIREMLIPKYRQLSLSDGNMGITDRALRGDTTPIILIETLETILKDDKAYRRFKKFDKEFFDHGITLMDYASAFKGYVEFLLRREVSFTKKELRRVQKITGEKYSSPKKTKKLLPKTVVGEFLRNPETLSEFERENLEDQSKYFRGIHPDDIKQEIMTVYESLVSNVDNVDSSNLHPYVGRIRKSKSQTGGKFISYNLEKVDTSKEINPDLKKLVVSKIPENIKDKEELAFCIYVVLNEVLQYDSTYFALGKKKSNEQIRRLFETDISEITPDKNSVICKAWAELYSYFLKMYGIESSIVSVVENGVPSNHKYVEIYLDDQVVKADATNITLSENDRTVMSDLTRCKLGVMPAGFESKKIDSLSRKFNVQSIDKRIEEIRELIESKEKQAPVDEIDENLKEREEIKRKIMIISDQIKQSKLDNMANVQYLRNLCYIFLGAEQQKGIVNQYNSLYTRNPEGRCFLKTVISINIGTSGQPMYKYVILNNKEDGLQQIQGDELMRAISEGVLHIRPSSKEIPGLDYEVIQQNIERRRQERMQSKEVTDHQEYENYSGRGE